MAGMIYISASQPPFKLASRVDGKRVYRKELIYTGDFVKKAGGTEQRFSVSDGDLKHWSETGNQMIAAGVKVPMPKDHTDDPEENRGNIVGYEVGRNAENKNALFGFVVFKDDESEKALLNSDVSIFVPDSDFTDGQGNTYVKPIRHVAFTSYPVIPKLGNFEAIVASYVKPKERDMTLSELASKLGITLAEDADETAQSDAIVAAWNDLKAKAEKPADPPAEPTGPAKEPVKEPIAAGFINMARDNRSGKIEALVAGGKITKAVADDLKKQYCSDQALQLSLTDTGSFTDGFDNLVATLSKNQAIEVGEKTGPQGGVALSHSNGGESTNPLIASAERRAEEAKAQAR